MNFEIYDCIAECVVFTGTEEECKEKRRKMRDGYIIQEARNKPETVIEKAYKNGNLTLF